jgi:hypothetical protein
MQKLGELAVLDHSGPDVPASVMSASIEAAGATAGFAWDEFFLGDVGGNEAIGNAWRRRVGLRTLHGKLFVPYGPGAYTPSPEQQKNHEHEHGHER